MGFYARYVLPRLIEFSMKNPEMSRLRAAWIPRATGEVLEVGIGSGLNLPFYSSGVRHIYGWIHPSNCSDWPREEQLQPRSAWISCGSRLKNGFQCGAAQSILS